jgi:hypothetical protein
VKKTSSKKIRLSRETLKTLTASEAGMVKGGIIRATESKPYACPSSNDPTAC